MRDYCTYFDERYLDKALALIRSLDRHAGDYRLHCVTMTFAATAAMERLALRRVRIVPIEQIEAWDAGLKQAKESRSRLAYYWTTTPAVMLYLLEQVRLQDVTYLDADLFFFSDPEVLFAEEPDADLLIHEHRHDAPIRWLRRRGGRFNVGLVSARNTAKATAVLRRWRAQCLQNCSAEPGKSGFGDQLYLNDWPSLDARVHILAHAGAGVAPWNILSTQLGLDGGRALVNGQPLVFFHFHAMIRRPGGGWTLARRYYLPAAVREQIYRPYMEEIDGAVQFLRREIPGYAEPVTARSLKDWMWDALFAWQPTARLTWWLGSVVN